MERAERKWGVASKDGRVKKRETGVGNAKSGPAEEADNVEALPKGR